VANPSIRERVWEEERKNADGRSNHICSMAVEGWLEKKEGGGKEGDGSDTFS